MIDRKTTRLDEQSEDTGTDDGDGGGAHLSGTGGERGGLAGGGGRHHAGAGGGGGAVAHHGAVGAHGQVGGHHHHTVVVLEAALGHGVKWAGGVGADGIQLGALLLDDGGGWGAAVVEELAEGHSGGHRILGGDAEGGGGETDLLDEVAHLVGVEGHELVDLVLAGDTSVFGETHLAVGGAAEEHTEVGVQVGQQHAGKMLAAVDYGARGGRRALLVGGGVHGRLVHLQWRGSSSVEEVLGDTLVTTGVGGGEHAVEVLDEVDVGSIVFLASGEDTSDS